METVTTWSLTLCIALSLVLIRTESLEPTLARCCNLGVKWAWEDKICSEFATPVSSVRPEHQGPCLTAIEACCTRNYRERQCSLGHEVAKSGRECREGTEIGGIFHKDCCEGCKLGLIAGSMGLYCEFPSLKLALGPPWDLSLTKCCLQAGGLSRTRPTVSSTPQDNNNLGTKNMCELFPAQLCSQLCISEGESYRCACNPGYHLLPDKKSCLMDNSTQRRQSLMNSNSVRDTDRMLAASTCPIGFIFNTQSQICDDIDECQLAENVCKKFPYKTCVNTIGSFLCEQAVRENERSLHCPPGYRYNEHQATCIDINECAEGAHICNMSIHYCINTPGGFDCQGKKEFSRYSCPAGYKFNNFTLNCEDVNECVENLSSCSESEVCRNTAGAYDCDAKCEDGFVFDIRLRSCQDKNECVLGTHDCLSGKETCVNVAGSYQCHQIQNTENNCPPGYEPNLNISFLCQDVDECERSFLHTCETSETCVNEIGGYRCEPSTDSDDSTTPVKTIDSSSSPSDRIQRKVFGERNGGENSPCKPGLRLTTSSGGEPSCEDIDECRENFPCENSQLCHNTIGSYYCHCKNGYYRDPITKSCQDVNECQTGQHSCTSSQRCDNSPGSYTCIRITGCGTGYTLNSGTGECEDDDECLFGNHNCYALGPEWHCKNTLGSFRCERVLKTCPDGLSLASTGECRPTCNLGFQFNSRGECVDIDECRQVSGLRPVCQTHQRCVNSEGSYQCLSKIICPSGYELDAAGTRCVDLDECISSHNCKSNQICLNRPGSYICQCQPGHIMSPNGECEDIDECARFGGEVCSSNSDCYNTPGSFRCICKEGFQQGNDNHTCDDVDECASADTHRLCEQSCVNTWGSFRCACDSGFNLARDERTCEDVDECSGHQGSYLCVGTCQNTHGSYKCACPEGYRLGGDGRTCHDIDECKRSPCRGDESCLNTRGGFRCNRMICPHGYQKEGDGNDKCKKTVQCAEGDSACLKLPLTISRNYLSFTSDVRLGSLGYMDMFTMKGPNWAGAVMHFTLELKSARAPSGVEVVTRDYFLLRRPFPYQAVISLAKPISGPQDVELELVMEVYHRGTYAGAATAQIVIVVTGYKY